MLNLEKNNSDITLKERSKIVYDSLAIIYFNKSLRSDSNDEILISKNYSELAELNFRNKEYLKAGLYYDSTLNVLNSKSREFRKVKKKRDNLKDLIFYETLSIELDSIINLIKMSDENRIAFFNDYIKKISK